MKKRQAQVPKDLVKRELGYIRDKMKEDGYYDGRFRPKTYESKKEKFLRNKKHHLDQYMDLV
jgi:hypothetical protein